MIDYCAFSTLNSASVGPLKILTFLKGERWNEVIIDNGICKCWYIKALLADVFEEI